MTTASHRLELSPLSWVEHVPGWLPGADRVLERLLCELPWGQQVLHLYGRKVAQPRLTALCGRSMDPASRYRRPNREMPWTPTAAMVRDAVARSVPDWEPNGLIANRYRDGADSISWHADDEPALGSRPLVVSVSLGARRTFRLRPRDGGPTTLLELEHGDLLVMRGETQREFVHAINKSARPTGPRLSLTYRRYDDPAGD
jgi:alkylated DNA repair dioxygenase AlkB